jgi:hypothetical protein
MHTYYQGKLPFNEWYQKWSHHASRATTDERTKMYAFRKNINPALHQKILGITPTPTTLAALVKAAREFDNLFHLYNSTAFRGGRSVRARGLNTQGSDNPLEINLYQGEPNERPWESRSERKPLTDAEKEFRRKNNLCYYCGKKNHMANQCRAKKAAQGCQQQGSHPQTVRATTIQDENIEPAQEEPVPVASLTTWRETLADSILRPRSAPMDF